VTPDRHQTTQRIVWTALVASQGILLAVLQLRPAAETAGAPTPSFDLLLTIGAMLAMLGASAFRRVATSDGQLQRLAEQALQAPPGARTERFYALTLLPMIVSMVLNETVALAGFVLAIVHNEPGRFWPFLGVALVLDALVFPRPAALFERARQRVPALSALVFLALLTSAACSFRGGDFTPMPQEAQTPCLKEAEEICKAKLGSADFGNCKAREKYRCEVMEEDQKKQDPNSTP
jgi:hypothetical protein